MAAFVKFENFVEDLAKKVHDFRAAGDTLKIYLSNTAPTVSTNKIKTDLAEISAGNGYSAGGVDTQNDVSRTGGTLSVTGVDVVITASGGTIGPFRYVVLYNDTPTSPADPLIGYWDYGAALTLNDAETFTADFGASMFTIT